MPFEFRKGKGADRASRTERSAQETGWDPQRSGTLWSGAPPTRTGLNRLRRYAILALVLLIVLGLGAAMAFGPRWLASTLRKPLTRTPRALGIDYKPVEFSPSDLKITLRAWWMPAPRAKAAIILVHGRGGNKSLEGIDGLELARDLIHSGYSVLALDLRNHGESDAAPDNRAMAGEAEAHDVSAAIEYLTQKALAQRFGVLGFSMGGAAAIFAAGTDPRIEALVTVATYVDARGAALRNTQAATGVPGFVLSGIFWSAEMFYGYSFKGSTLDGISRIPLRPILIIHNEADPIVSFDDARRLAHESLSAQLWITPAPPPNHPVWNDAGAWGMHLRCYQLYPRDFVSNTVTFLDSVLTAPPGRPGLKRTPARP